MKNSWTNPKVKSYPLDSGKDWYVWFRFNGVLKFVKIGLNQIQDYDERLSEAQALADVLKERLQKGWIPLIKEKKIVEAQQREILTLNDALDFGLQKKKHLLSTSSYKDYKCSVNFFKYSAKKNEIDKIPIHSCERYHVKLVMDFLQNEKKWKNKNFNKHLGVIKTIFSELVEWDYLKFNIVRDIRSKKEEKTEGYIQPTDDQQRVIFDYLKKIDYNFYVFCCIEYYLGIRPKEILLLKCNDIDLNERLIKISAEDSKDNSYRYVPILEPVFSILKKWDLSEKGNYLIGRPKPYGTKFPKEDYFCPNPYKINRKTATHKWRVYIIDGLKINVKCYSLKHKGANDKLKAGIPLKTISEMFGHSEEKITEIYANYMNKIRFDEAKNIVLDEY
jgi:integrase